jgi:phage terminase small subunit
MSKFTDKQQKFVANKAAGVKNREAAIAAGYSPNTADVQASNLLRRPAIKAAITAAKEFSVASDPSSTEVMPRSHYADPMGFLEDVMNHALLPLAFRMDAARQLLPYKHARIGEKGKKEQAKERAHEIASRPRFSPKPPPKLQAI